jgi:ribose transport system permease protein
MANLSTQAATNKTGGKRGLSLQDVGDWWTVGILVLLILIFSFTAPGFFSLQNFVSVTVYASTTLILAVAETFVIITAGIDLSVGAILGLSGMVGGWVMEQTLPHGAGLSLILGIVAGLLCGTVLGLINGLIIAYMEVTPFITTLGMLGMATGFTFLITNGSDIVNLPQQVSAIGNTVWLHFLAIPFFITLVIIVIAAYFLKNTRFGRYTYAIGSNAEGTRRSGVNVKRHLMKIYMISGLLSGIAGVLVLARLVSGSPLEGQNDELNAIAAVVIGGASLFGGRGSMLASTVGGLIISVLVVGLVILGVQPYWQTVSIGVIIILAVYVDQRRYRNRVLK